MKPLFLPFLLFGLISCTSLRAQTPDSILMESHSLLDYFCHELDSLPRVKLDTDWGVLLRTKMAEQYQDAAFSFHHPDGRKIELKVKMRTRGNIRKEVCYYPPVKVKLPKKELKELGFNSMNEIKLVFPCGNSPKEADYLLREALIYELWKVIHPVFIRTKVVGLDAWKGPKQRFSSFGLLVEHEEEISARLKGPIVDRGVLNASGLERDAYLKMVFFQYMISNTDWSIPNRHNVLVMQVPGYSRVMAIPYDFDYSGFVNAPYAIPAEIFPIKDVTERYFLGFEVSEAEAQQTARFFLEKKEALLDRVATYDLMEERSRREIREDLEEFFKILETDKAVLRNFVTKK
ncbi:MAG: hypothetical protein IPH04_12155 [Saprospirales bacterium]|nr:hypothetical protein [Saprospirales bacterium]